MLALELHHRVRFVGVLGSDYPLLLRPSSRLQIGRPQCRADSGCQEEQHTERRHQLQEQVDCAVPERLSVECTALWTKSLTMYIATYACQRIDFSASDRNLRAESIANVGKVPRDIR